jgi:hypothetical protein
MSSLNCCALVPGSTLPSLERRFGSLAKRRSAQTQISIAATSFQLRIIDLRWTISGFANRWGDWRYAKLAWLWLGRSGIGYAARHDAPQ